MDIEYEKKLIEASLALLKMRVDAAASDFHRRVDALERRYRELEKLVHGNSL